MFMICIICGKPTGCRYDTTAVCDKCKDKYYKRVAINERAVYIRQSIEEVQRAFERKEEKE